MSAWQLRAVCPGCGKHFDGDAAKFFGCCPTCGADGEWDFGPTWDRQPMRWVCQASKAFRWYKPWTWGCDGRWEALAAAQEVPRG